MGLGWDRGYNVIHNTKILHTKAVKDCDAQALVSGLKAWSFMGCNVYSSVKKPALAGLLSGEICFGNG